MVQKYPYITGFCAVGLCEGLRPKDKDGRPMKVCEHWQLCQHACHADISKLYEMTGMERVSGQNPEYLPQVASYIMPSLEERATERVVARSGPVVADTVYDELAETLPNGAPSIMPTTFAPTPSGQRARGQLELEVLEISKKWVSGQLPWEVCTPTLIANEIDVHAPPSVGAIQAVFDRWQEYGFAVIERKPVRLTAITAEGNIKGLDVLKEMYRLKKGRK